MKANGQYRKTLKALLALSLLGGSVQGSARILLEYQSQAEAQHKVTTRVMDFITSVKVGKPYRTLMTDQRAALLTALTDAKFEPVAGLTGPDHNADAYYCADMNYTVLLGRSEPVWLTVQRGQPSTDINYDSVSVTAR